MGEVDEAEFAAAGLVATQVKISVGEIFSRWVQYVTGAVLAGGMIFILAVWQPAYWTVRWQARDKIPSTSTPWKLFAMVAIIGLVLGNIFWFLVQTGQVSDVEIALPWSPITARLLFDTRHGSLWLARLALVLFIAGFVLRANQRRDPWLAFGASLLLLLTISPGSHAGAEAYPFLLVLGDWIHLIASSVWVGGLVHFVGGLWATREGKLDSDFQTRFVARLIPRVSAVALITVGLMVLTGLYAAVLRVGSLDVLFSTLYGRILIVKSLLALPMLLLGAINLLNTSLTMHQAAQEQEGDGSLVERFRKLVSSEVVLGVLIMLVVGIFTAVPPARASATVPSLRGSTSADDLDVVLDISPGRMGVNTFTLSLKMDGISVKNVIDSTLRFTPLNANIPPIKAKLTRQGEGVYSIEGSYLSLPDTWQIEVVVRRGEHFDAFANFDFEIADPNSAQPFPWYQAAAPLLLFVGIGYLLAIRAMNLSRGGRLLVGQISALAFVLMVVYVFFVPPVAQETELQNPITADAESIVIGEALYQKSCLL